MAESQVAFKYSFYLIFYKTVFIRKLIDLKSGFSIFGEIGGQFYYKSALQLINFQK